MEVRRSGRLSARRSGLTNVQTPAHLRQPARYSKKVTMPADVRPIVVVSQCLGFAAVRYDGRVLRDDFVKALSQHVTFTQVCPEVGIGLGVPRAPIRIVAD